MTTDLRLEVTRRIRAELENGRDYYALEGKEIGRLSRIGDQPNPEALRWHNETRFRI